MNIPHKTSTYMVIVVALALFLFAVHQMLNHPVRTPVAPAFPPATTLLRARVAGVGVVEPQSELISIGVPVGGVVQRICVKPGQRVRQGETLFILDQRDLQAQLARAEAAVESGRVVLENAQSQLGFYENLSHPQAVSKEELSRRQYAVKHAEAKLQELDQEVKDLQTKLQLLVIVAPQDVDVLRVSIHEGEYAPAGVLSKPLMVLGDMAVPCVRVAVDEIDAQRIHSSCRAHGSLRGAGDKTVPLTFVRQEPLLKHKSSLTNEGQELVDTRVLEVIYAFSNEDFKAYPGQQMDVFIETVEK